MSIEATIRNYIQQTFMFTDGPTDLQNDESFLNRGIIDSTGILEVVLFLETEFGIKVEDRDFVPENLDSVDNLVRFVGAKRAAVR